MFLLFEVSIKIFASVTKIWPTLYIQKLNAFFLFPGLDIINIHISTYFSEWYKY